MISQRTRRRAPHRFSGVHDLGRKDARPGADYRAGFDPRLVSYADLAADHRVVAYRDAAREACLRCDHNVVADLAVVADMNLVIEFYAVADPSHAESRAIDATIRADLDIVAHLNRADLGKLDVPALLVEREPETVRADHATRVQDCVTANANTVVNRHVWVENTPLSNRNAPPNHAPGPDGNAGLQTKVFRHNRRWMNTGGNLRGE